MKNMFKKLVCVGLVGLFVLGNTCNTVEAEIIQGKNGTVYINYDKIEEQENKLVLEECFKIKSYKTIWNKKKNTYTVEFKTNKKTSCKDVKKIVKQVAKKLHGSTTIEKEFKEFRTYNILVKAKDKKGHIHTSYIKGHKIIK